MLFKFPITLLAISSGAMAYSDNCKGSTNSPNIDHCLLGIGKIDAGLRISSKTEFSYKSCYIVYATNDDPKGSNVVTGQKIKDVATRIINECGQHHGSYGTGNCDKCHVTVNYKKY